MTEANTLDLVFGEGGIQAVFHPIVDLRSPASVHGYEGLMRGPKGYPFEGPMLAFALAKSLEVLEEFDLRCLETAVASCPEGRLFGNIHPTTVIDVGPDRIVELVSRAGRAPGNVVLEIIEHDAGREADLIRAIGDLRSAGFGVAIDDFGEGSSNLRRLLRAQPDYLKIDRWFVQGCEDDPARAAVLRAVAQLGRDLDLEVIAEGVESRRQLDTLRNTGVHLVQGWGLQSLLGNVGAEVDDRTDSDPSPDELPESVMARIDDFEERHLDRLPFGVIQLAVDGTILQYNRYEENLAGFDAARVVGRNFFTEVAPCTDVQEFSGRFRDGIARGRLHRTFDFVFAFDRPKNVRVTLFLSRESETVWVFVQEIGD